MPVIIDKAGMTYGIVPSRCPADARPKNFSKAELIGPIKSVILHDTAVERTYNNSVEQSVTEPKFDWILKNATAPIAVELAGATNLMTNTATLMLMVSFSKAADARAYRAAEKAGII